MYERQPPNRRTLLVDTQLYFCHCWFRPRVFEIQRVGDCKLLNEQGQEWQSGKEKPSGTKGHYKRRRGMKMLMDEIEALSWLRAPLKCGSRKEREKLKLKVTLNGLSTWMQAFAAAMHVKWTKGSSSSPSQIGKLPKKYQSSRELF